MNKLVLRLLLPLFVVFFLTRPLHAADVFHADESHEYCVPKSDALIKIMKKSSSEHLFNQTLKLGPLTIPKGCRGHFQYVDGSKRTDLKNKYLSYVHCDNHALVTFSSISMSDVSLDENQCFYFKVIFANPTALCGRTFHRNGVVYFDYGKLDCRRTILLNIVGSRADLYPDR